MERLLQYMDDIDDLIGAIGLVYERLRRLVLTITVLFVSLALMASNVRLALVYPRVALATCLLLLLILLYSALVSPSRERLQTA